MGLIRANLHWPNNWPITTVMSAACWGGQIICVIPALDMVVVLKSDSENPESHAYYEILTLVIEAGVKSDPR